MKPRILERLDTTENQVQTIQKEISDLGPASKDTLGLVRIGKGVSVNEKGEISVNELFVVSVPEISTARDRLPLGAEADITLKSITTLDGAVIERFEVAYNGQTAELKADDNGTAVLSVFLDTETWAEDDVFALDVTAYDNFNNASVKEHREFTVSTINEVNAPVFGSPATNEVVPTSKIAWTLKSFSVFGKTADVHSASQFRLLSPEGAIVYDSGETMPVSYWVISSANYQDIVPGKYIMQARYKGETLGWSPWGEVTAVLQGVKTPSVTFPSNGSFLQNRYGWIESSDFAVDLTDAVDTHVASQYQARDAGGTVVYDSGETTDLLQHSIAVAIGLLGVDLYVRHRGEVYGWSDWSEPVSVTLVEAAWENEEVQEYITAGSYNCTVPDHVTQMRVLVVGGGGGGKTYSSMTGGSGGKGGGILSALVSVTPGEVIPVVVGDTGTISASPKSGGTSSFGDLLKSTGGSLSERGTASYDEDSLILLLSVFDETPCSEYKSCKSFAEMSLNAWAYDTSFTAGEASSDGKAGTAGSVGLYGIGGTGGSAGSTTGSTGYAGGKGGAGGGLGGNGGKGGHSSASYGNGGAGGTGGKGGSGSSSTSAKGGPGGLGGEGGTYGGIGGKGGDGGGASSGTGGAGGTGGSGGSTNGNGGNGAPGGPGCVIIWYPPAPEAA